MATKQENNTKVYKGVTDLPITELKEDNLDILNYIEGLADFIRSCATPMTIALQGDWGTGKTSFMNLVKDQLDNSDILEEETKRANNNEDVTYDKVKTIEFNTWKYAQFNQEQNLSISFLIYVVSQLYDTSIKEVIEKTESNINEDTKEKGFISTLKVVGKLMSGVMSNVAPHLLSSYLGIDPVPVVEKTEVSLNTKNTNEYLFQRMAYIDSALAIESLKKEFIKAVENRLVKDDVQRIVIFIDDLDRLDPIIAVNLLEVIKIFLDVPKCVFVLSVDYAIVTKGVKLKNRDLDMDDEKAQNFFDKMIQVPFRIPMEFYNFEDFLRTNLPGITNFSDLHKLIRHSIGNNPRGVKRLLNSYYLISNIMFRGNDTDFDEKQRGQLIALLCMQLSHEPLYRYFCSDTSEQKILLALLAKSEQDVEKLLKEENISYSKSNLRKHLLFLGALRYYLFGDKPLEDISLDNEDDQEVLELFATTLSFANITSETTTEEIEEIVEVPMREIGKYSPFDYGIAGMYNENFKLRYKTANGLAFELYKKIFEQNPYYLDKLRDYTQLPKMKAAGIEKRLILPFLKEVYEQPEAKAWIEQNMPDYLFKHGEYSEKLNKRELLPGGGYYIITNYSALGAIQNLYYILNYLEDENIDKTTVRLKKKK